MKHAVLIIAHKNKEQLIRLIRSLSCDTFHFYVHLDARWMLSNGELEEISECAPNVFLSSKRIHGELDHWSLPQIALNLIDDALYQEKQMGGGYAYFLLLSGQDYPIKSTEYIVAFLEQQYPRPLIDIDPYREGNWAATKFMLVRWSHNVEEMHDRYKPGILRKCRVAPYVVAEHAERLFYGTPYQRIVQYNISLWGGSQWWVLPHQVIDFIQKKREESPKLIREFSRTWTPEETFFQTMTMNSPMANTVLKDTDLFEEGDLRCMTYANFKTPTKPFRGHPHVIGAEDYGRVMAKKQLFARKFDESVDKDVLEMIDKATGRL